MEMTVQGLDTHYEIVGDGPETVLLLHGWGVDSSWMNGVAARLKKYYRVVSVDFPAHGQTQEPKDTVGVPEYAQWTQEFMRLNNIQNAHVVAHSFGGRVALYLVAHHPQLINKLVLTGSAGLTKPKTFKATLKKLRYRLGRTFLKVLTFIPYLKPYAKKWLENYRNRHNSKDYQALDEGMRKTFQKIISFDSREFLSKIKHKTLLVWGEQDTETPLWMAKELKEKIAGSRLSVIPGGHFAFMQYPDPFCDLVLDFLEETEQ
jgi:pimeloyl-ACP methyl ester carboxylesterase